MTKPPRKQTASISLPSPKPEQTGHTKTPQLTDYKTCAKCSTMAAHVLGYCGNNRICEICTLCGWHTCLRLRPKDTDQAHP